MPVYLIDLANNRIASTFKGPKDTIRSLAFSHDGKRLAAGGTDGTTYLWDATSGELLQTLEGHKAEIHDLAFSPDDKRLATASWDKTARIWSVKTGKDETGPLPHEDAVNCVSWKNNEVLATGGAFAASIHLWDRDGKPLQHFDKLRNDPVVITAVAFVPGSQELFYTWTQHLDKTNEMCTSGGAFLNVASPNKSRDGYTWDHHTSEVRGELSPDGKIAATTGAADNRIDLWSVKDGKPIVRLVGKGDSAVYTAWGPDGWVAAWSRSKKTSSNPEDLVYRKFDLGDLEFAPRQKVKLAQAMHSNGELHLERSDLHEIQVKSKKSTVKITTPFVIQCYTLLPGDRVAVGYANVLALYDARTGQQIHRLGGHTGKVWDLAPSPDGRYLMGAFADQTLRIWDLEQTRPLLSLFVAGNDWITWTEEGYYAASPGGERLMGWQVNNGMRELGTFYPAAQFHKTFYRPDVIQKALSEGSVVKARTAADKAGGKATEAVDLAHALPPDVRIVTPYENDLKLDKPSLEISAEAESKDRAIVSLRLLLDGRPFAGAEVKKFPDGKAGKRSASWTVTAPEGNHAFSVLAESEVSSAASRDLLITYQPQPQEVLPSLYVLTIGINNYPGSLKLNWAVTDAESIEAAFAAGGAPRPFGKVTAHHLLDDKATGKAILDELDWLKTAMSPDDTAIVFYAGHGHRDRKTSQFYMLPFDVDVRDLPKTGVTGTQVKEKLKAVPGRVLVLLDACHSGAIGASPPDPGSLTDDVQRQLAAPDCGVVIMCAAMAQEEAGESPEVRDGFFTKALLKGLSGAAPRDKDGLIHLTGLNYYVEQEVAELSKDEQHVVIDRPATVTSFPLVMPHVK